MIITEGQTVLSVEPIRSSNSTAAYTGLTSNLVDGRVGTMTAFSWVTGAQTTGSYVTLIFKLTPAPTSTTVPQLFAILNFGSMFQEGTVIELYGGTSNNPTNLMYSTTIQQLPNGKLGAWVYMPSSTQTYQYWGWRIYNNKSGATYLTAGLACEVGEVFGDYVKTFPLSQFKVSVVDPTKTNRSSGNQPWPVMRFPFRKVDATIVPTPFASAFISSGNLMDLQFKLATAKYCAIVPRDRARAAVSPDAAYVQRMAMLCRMTDLGMLQSQATEDYWPLQLTAEENL